MTDRKSRIVSNGAKAKLYEEEPDLWAKLKGEEFRNLNKDKVWQLVSLCVAEACGTAVLVGLGCSSLVTIPGAEGHVDHLNIILTFACAIAVVVAVFGHVSGCHVNPAVSLSAVIFGQFSIPKFLMYTVSQCIGACLGIAALRMVTPGKCMAGAFCVTKPNVPEVSVMEAMMSEAFTTGILVWVVNAAWDRRCQDKHDSLPVKFALAIVALALPGAKYSGASLNPARSFGPALMSGDWTHHWVYWVGPMVGSIVASALYRTFFSEMHPPPPARPHINDGEEEHPL